MISTARLVNFKCFEDQSLWMLPLTVLAGQNAMGKSSVMQALLLLRQSYQYSVLHSGGLVLNGELVSIGLAEDLLFQDATHDTIGIHLEWSAGDKGSWLFRYQSEADIVPIQPSPVAESVYGHDLFTDDFHYLQAERIGPRTFFSTSDFLVRQHGRLGCAGEYTAQFLSVFGLEDIPNSVLAHPGAVSMKLRDQAEAWLGEVSPNVRLHVTEHPDMGLVNLQYSFVSAQDVGRRYRATNVGFGLTFALPIIVAVLFARPGSLVLIENPEAHLHARAQVKMGELFARAANCGVQLLVETHSDHIVNGIRIAVHDGLLSHDNVALHFFTRPAENAISCAHVASPQMGSDGRIAYAPEGFFDEWTRSLESLL